MKKLISIILVLLLFVAASLNVYAMESDDGEVDETIFEDSSTVFSVDEINISVPSAILMEKETGTIIYEKNSHEQMEPASVTKVMTMLLIVEEIESGRISLDDMVTTSSYAASMGGSQIFLEDGEQLPVQEMLKSIVVASANDAAVAMAEYIAGTEGTFVSKMNARAKELGMNDTNFCNCTGLLDQSEHLTSAYDIAIMSRELIKHDMIKEYTTIWMDTVRGGEFGLSNTNKLIRYYEGATGLKTGFTSSAMYCLSATAERDGVEYIAVVMHGETSNDRFESAKTLLNFAFANYTLTEITSDEKLDNIEVKLGTADSVEAVIEGSGPMLLEKTVASGITKTIEIEESLVAPVEEGQVIGHLYVNDASGKEIATLEITAKETVEKLSVWKMFLRLMGLLCTGNY